MRKRRRGHQEGSIFQRSDGLWVGAITVGYREGRRIRKTFYAATRAEVAKRLTDTLAKKQAGLPVKTERQTVGEFLDRWLEECVKLTVRPRTFRSYSDQIRLYIKPAIGHIQLTKLMPQDVQRFINQLTNTELKQGRLGEPKRRLSGRVVCYIRTILKMALQRAVKWRLIAFNPAADVEVPKVEQRKVDPLSPEQARALLAAIQGDRLTALFMVIFGLGLRRGEALGLHWRDIDLKQRKLRVRTILQRIDGALVLGDPKSPSSRRELTIPASVVSALRDHRARQHEEQLRAGSKWHNAEGLVFTTGTGRPVDPRTAKRGLDRMLVAAGLPHYRIHDLRHFYASGLLAEGVELKVIADILGHTDIALTSKVYAHVSESSIKDAMDRFDRFTAAR
jgi:integrase